MPFLPFLHPADAASHAPAWLLALCLVGGAGVGLAITSGGTIVRRLHPPVPPARFVLQRWGARDGSCWAEIEDRQPGPELPVDGWRVRTNAGRLLPATIELLPGTGRRLGLVVALEPGDAPSAVEYLPPGAGSAWQADLR
ncbi:MAG: hypothetical protein ACM3S1_15495 [Hyphomicrobiales bacterium]